MCLRNIRMVSKGKEKRISFEAEGERRMRRRRKFSSNPSWVRVYEIKLIEFRFIPQKIKINLSNKNRKRTKLTKKFEKNHPLCFEVTK